MHSRQPHTATQTQHATAATPNRRPVMATTDRLEAAGGTTKRYLAALGIRGWLTLGVVVLLFSIGGGIGLNTLGALTPEQSVESINWQQATGPAAIALLVVGVVGYVAAVADFVFVASLRSGRLPVRSYVKANLRRAGWLVVFRAAIVLGAVAVVAAVIAATVGITQPPAAGELTGGESLLIGVTAAVAAVGWLVISTLTNAFVVPIMQYEHRGPLSGWRRFTRAISGHWTAVVVFLLIAVVISTVVGVALFVVSFFVMTIGGLLLAGGGILVAESVPALEPVVLITLVASYLGYRYVVSLIRAPVRSYLRYYALLLLGDVAPSLAMIADDVTDKPDTTDGTSAGTAAVEAASDDVDNNAGDDKVESTPGDDDTTNEGRVDDDTAGSADDKTDNPE